MRVLSVLVVVLGVVTVVFPSWLLLPIYFFTFLPRDIPYGVSARAELEQNFQEHRSTLEAIVTTVRADDLTNAQRGYWSMTGYKTPEPRETKYRQLYRDMRQAHVQKINVLKREPLEVELVTDEQSAIIDANRYGYTYDEDPDGYASGSYSPLSDRWAVLEELP